MIKGERRTAASWKGLAILAIVAGLQGCSWDHSREPLWDDVAHYRQILQQTSYEDAACPEPLTTATAGPPIMIDDTAPQQYWDLTLQEAVELALTN